MSISVTADNGFGQTRRPSRSLMIKAVVLRQLSELRHTPTRANDMLVWPVIDSLLFGSLGVFLALQAGTSLGAGTVLSGLFLFHVIFQSAVGVTMGFMTESGARNIANLMASPLRAFDFILGLLVFGVIRMWIGLGVITISAYAFFSYNVFEGGWRMLPIMAELIVVGISVAFLLIGMQLRLGKSAEQATWATAGFIPTISGAFVPISALPAVIRPISNVLPTTHAFNAARSLKTHPGLPWHELGITALGAVVVFALASLFLFRMVRTFTRLGLVTRYS